MSIIKRMSTGLFAQIDQIVGDIENHDALIKAAIGDQRRKIAGAKVQLNKIQSSVRKADEQIRELQLKEQRWSERALKEASANETQAMACLQRRQLVREQIEKVKSARDSYHQTAEKMKGDIARCDQELKSMTQKHEIMRARQSSADALNVISEVNGTNIDALETSFDRWEIKISQHEINVDSYDSVDVLDQSYINAENEEQLRSELAELLEQENSHEQS